MIQTIGPRDIPSFLNSLFAAAVAAALPTQGPAARKLAAHLPGAPKGRTVVLGAGKAAGSMARAVEDAWKGPLEGLVIVPDGYAQACRMIEVVEAAHPVPDQRGLAAAARILARANAATADDLVLCLISGGASSLMVAPAEGIALAEKRAITAALLRSGASITELNCVRKHLSAIKGGRLAAAAAPARVISLIISDVVGDDPSVIASGPTVVDPTTCAEALAVLARYGISPPAHVVDGLRSGRFETPKRLPMAAAEIIARPRDSLAAAAALARARGFAVHDLGDGRAGEARDEARVQADLVRAILAGAGPVTPPCVILSGGEVVVTVRGEGRGGPNTEFALAFGLACEDLENVWLLAADTDGQDGAARAAGAMVWPGLIRQARAAGVNPEQALADNDSAGCFAAYDALVTPGPTFTNVNDLRAVVILPK